jgi:hypothetical protein
MLAVLRGLALSWLPGTFGASLVDTACNLNRLWKNDFFNSLTAVKFSETDFH